MPVPDDHRTVRLRVAADRTVSLELAEDRWFEAPICDDPLTRLAVARLDRFVTSYPESCERDDFRLLGAMLFDMLFGGRATEVVGFTSGGAPARQLQDKTLGDVFLACFETACTGAPGGAAFRFRLSLVFEEGTDALARLPWEFLYVSRKDDRGIFVAGQDTRLILTRVLPPPVARASAPQDPVTLWIAWAQPDELGALLKIEELAASIKDRLQRGGVQVEAHSLADLTWKRFEEALADPPGGRLPDIIHFIGHGRLTGGGSELAFKRSPEEMDKARREAPLHATVGDASWRSVADLGARLRGKAPWLFFLHSCSTARAAISVEAFRSAAQQVARADVPFVVAMQYEIANDDAQSFAEEFYDKLGNGQSIDDAVKAGRSRLGDTPPAWGHRRFATPVVYLRGDAQVLVRAPQIAPSALHRKQSCPYVCLNEIDANLKRCGCDKRRLLKYCALGHANEETATECRWRGCNERFEVSGVPMQPQGAPAAAPGGLGVA